MIKIVKCPCGHKSCRYYSLSDGVFYAGSGWDKERAQEYADAINAYDADKAEAVRIKDEMTRFAAMCVRTQNDQLPQLHCG